MESHPLNLQNNPSHPLEPQRSCFKSPELGGFVLPCSLLWGRLDKWNWGHSPRPPPLQGQSPPLRKPFAATFGNAPKKMDDRSVSPGPGAYHQNFSAPRCSFGSCLALGLGNGALGSSSKCLSCWCGSCGCVVFGSGVPHEVALLVFLPG